jgi:hypothetical protein
MSGNRIRVQAVVWFWLWIVAIVGFAQNIWRWVPRVRHANDYELRARFVRSTETVCPVDEAVHDCNMTLMGSCPVDYTRTRIEGIVLTIGPLAIEWPRA